MTPPTLDFRLLGGLTARCRRNGMSPTALEKPLLTLAYLMLAPPDGPKHRDVVVGMLWPEADAGRGRSSLRQALYSLRQACGEELFVKVGKHHVGTRPATVRCDVLEFDAAVREGRSDEAVRLYQGDFLRGARLLNVSEELADWVEDQRRRLREAAVGACADLLAGSADEGDVDGAVAWGRHAFGLAPGDDHTARRVLRASRRAGLEDGAVRLYREHAEWLDRQIGAEPTLGTRALVEDLLELPG